MDIWTINFPFSVALAVVATLGYLVGRRGRQGPATDGNQARREMKRAKSVVRELEAIIQNVRRGLATHHASVLHFKDHVADLSSADDKAAWNKLSQEAEGMLQPSMRLATQIAHAYDEIRRQTNLLMTLSGMQTDPLAGLSDRQTLDMTLKSMFALTDRYGTMFSLVIFEFDDFKNVDSDSGHPHGDQVLQRVGRVLDDCIRETDTVLQYGSQEFVVIMPETDLDGAGTLGERIRRRIERDKGLDVTTSIGIASALDGDSPRTLLARADSALYSAKATGRNCTFCHTGVHIEPIAERKSAAAKTPSGTDKDGAAEPGRSDRDPAKDQPERAVPV